MKEIEKQVQIIFGGWPKYSDVVGVNRSNLKRMIEKNLNKIERLNKVLAHLGLIIKITKK